MENIGSKWANRFIVAAIIQGGIMAAMALVIVGMQITYTQINIIQFLSLSFEGTAKWFFLGIIFYLIIIVAVAVTALFYIQIEFLLKKILSRPSRVLA